jgi:hypothetical protein
MLSVVNPAQRHIRVLTAIAAVLVLVVAPALHLSHGHDDGSLPGRLHAPCAACQIHAPSATPPQCPCGILALSIAYHVCAAPDEAPPASTRQTPEASRAPPFFVAS